MVICTRVRTSRPSRACRCLAGKSLDMPESLAIERTSGSQNLADTRNAAIDRESSAGARSYDSLHLASFTTSTVLSRPILAPSCLVARRPAAQTPEAELQYDRLRARSCETLSALSFRCLQTGRI